MEKMGVERKREESWRRGEGEGQFKAVTHGFLIGWLTGILQQIGEEVEMSIAWFFWFYFGFSIYLLLFFCNQIGLIRYTSCLFGVRRKSGWFCVYDVMCIGLHYCLLHLELELPTNQKYRTNGAQQDKYLTCIPDLYEKSQTKCIGPSSRLETWLDGQETEECTVKAKTTAWIGNSFFIWQFDIWPQKGALGERHRHMQTCYLWIHGWPKMETTEKDAITQSYTGPSTGRRCAE